jgi:hypothetical protein
LATNPHLKSELELAREPAHMAQKPLLLVEAGAHVVLKKQGGVGWGGQARGSLYGG